MCTGQIAKVFDLLDLHIVKNTGCPFKVTFALGLQRHQLIKGKHLGTLGVTLTTIRYEFFHAVTP